MFENVQKVSENVQKVSENVQKLIGNVPKCSNFFQVYAHLIDFRQPLSHEEKLDADYAEKLTTNEHK